MISAAKRTNKFRRSGFTLLEIIVVLSLTMLVIGGAIGMMYLNRDEAVLNDSVQEIEVLAKRARTIATLQQRPYALEFTADGVRLMPFAEATMEAADREMMIEGQTYAQEATFEEGEMAPPVQSSVRDSWTQDETEPMTILLRRWGSSDWIELKQRDRQVWRFDPNGISEPVGIRLEMPNGNWISAFFHPLTAAATEIESEIR
jgi:type II secretory pathway pseudopilin PulG